MDFLLLGIVGALTLVLILVLWAYSHGKLAGYLQHIKEEEVKLFPHKAVVVLPAGGSQSWIQRLEARLGPKPVLQVPATHENLVALAAVGRVEPSIAGGVLLAPKT